MQFKFYRTAKNLNLQLKRGSFYHFQRCFPAHDVGYLGDERHGYLALSAIVGMPRGTIIGGIVDDVVHRMAHKHVAIRGRFAFQEV